jgi:hypothetical protein
MSKYAVMLDSSKRADFLKKKNKAKCWLHEIRKKPYFDCKIKLRALSTFLIFLHQKHNKDRTF